MVKKMDEEYIDDYRGLKVTPLTCDFCGKGCPTEMDHNQSYLNLYAMKTITMYNRCGSNKGEERVGFKVCNDCYNRVYNLIKELKVI